MQINRAQNASRHPALTPGNKMSRIRASFIRIASSIIIIVTFLLLPQGCYSADLIDPGQMFSHDANHEATYDRTGSNNFASSILEPSLNNAWLNSNEDSSCSTGTGTVLKRIVYKLFNHVDHLQPNELDDEFLYYSTISYNDYLSMMKYLKDDKLNCASLHKLDALLSNFISIADVKRPSQYNPFASLLMNPFGLRDLNSTGSSMLRAVQQWPNMYLAIVLVSVGLSIWFFKHVAGYSEFKANVLGIMLPGFVQYYMRQHWLSLNNHKEKIERCGNPSYFSSLLTYFNYDYNNCHGTTNSDPHLFVTNVAVVWVEYLSELIFHPMITFATKAAKASQSYLDSFTGISGYLIGPLLLLFSIICLVIIVIFFLKFLIFSIFLGPSDDGSARSYQKSISNSSSRNAIASPRRKSIEYHNSSKNNGNSLKKNNKRN